MFEKIKQNNIKKKRMIDTMEGLKEYYERVATISDYSKLSRRDLYKEQRRTEIFIHLLKPHKDENYYMKRRIKILCVVGARPNFIKIAPLFEEERAKTRFNMSYFYHKNTAINY